MQDLEVIWPDGSARFSAEDSPVQIGRSSEAAVSLTEGSVSRRHLELAWGGSIWTASDSSTHGTFDAAGVRLAPRWTVAAETTVRLGGAKGVEIVLRPVLDHVSNDLTSTLPSNSAPPSSAPPNGAPSNSAPPNGLPPNGSVPVAAGGRLFAEDDSDAQPSGPPDRPDPPPLFSDVAEPPVAPPDADEPSAPILLQLDDEPASAEVAVPAMAPGPTEPGAPVEQPPHFEFPEPSPQAPEEPGVDFDPTPDVRLQPTPGVDDERPPIRLEEARPVLPGPGPTGGHPAVRLSANSAIISDDTLRINLDGQDYSYLPGAEVSVGRDPACLIQLDERHSLVSRKHLRVTHEDGHWWIEDFSSKGTFVDGKRLKGRYKAEGAFIANLGDDDAGTPMRVITSGEHRVPRRLNLLAVAALVAVALTPLLILAFLLTRGESAEGPDFTSAKQSTVMLFGLEQGQGSGFFVSDNLIVTNQHVAALSPQLLVAVSREADEPAEIEYATELVENHPFLDIAVLRISNKATNSGGETQIFSDPVGNIGLPAVTIGSSGDISLGDDVFSTGFPGRLSITGRDKAGELRLPPVAVTSGSAGNFTVWPGCGDPSPETIIPPDSPDGVDCSAGGAIRRGVLLSSFSSGQGASGSAVFRNNEVVAVVYAGDADDRNTSLSITTDVFSDWLSEVIGANS